MYEKTKSFWANTLEKDAVMTAIDPKLLEILVCPVTRETLSYDADAGELISKGARLAYPIRDGIPILLPDDARALSDDPTPTSSK